MLLDNLVPYAKNARHNDNAVPVVAQSIKDFGFKGAIVCDRTHEGGTYEHPIIVRSEALAECVADYMANGSKAKPLSRAVYNVLKNEL